MERKRFVIPEGAVDIVSGAYCLDDKTIIGIPRDVTEIVIPETVTKIGVFAFSPTFSFGNFTKLESVIIPDSVLNIGFWAFSGCSSLRSIEIPRSVTAIYNGAFDDCSSLTQIKVHPENEHFFDEKGVLFEGAKPDNSKYPRVKLRRFPEGRKAREYAIPGYVREIGNRAFDGCSSLIKVAFPGSVTRIGDSAFKGCSELTVAELPDSLWVIDDSAFKGCSRLEVPQLPRIMGIGCSAFEGCTFPGKMTIFGPSNKTVGAGAFAGCRTLTEIRVDSARSSVFHDRGGVLFDGNKLHTFPAGKKRRKYTIRKSVEQIEERAFEGCTALTEIIISDTIKNIPSGAFRGCTALTRIEMPESVQKIGEDAFENCTVLTRIAIPESVKEIGSSAFRGCTALTEIEVPGSVQKIESYAFSDCTALTEFKIPESVKEIGFYAFHGCTALTEIAIPASVQKIDSSAFSGCTSLDGFRVHPENASYREEDGVLFEGTILRIFPPGKKAQKYVIPGFVTEIGKRAFEGCSTLAEIEIPESVAKIGDNAFRGCSSLVSLVMPGHTEKIGYCAFGECHSLKSVRIPETVAEIGRMTFGRPAFESKSFQGCVSLEKIYVPKRLKLKRGYFHGCPQAELVEYGDADAAVPAVSENLSPEGTDRKTENQGAVRRQA